MKIEYDQQADALYIRLMDKPSVESEEVQSDVVLDFAESGEVVGIEIMNASQHTNVSEMIFAAIPQPVAA